MTEGQRCLHGVLRGMMHASADTRCGTYIYVFSDGRDMFWSQLKVSGAAVSACCCYSHAHVHECHQSCAPTQPAVETSTMKTNLNYFIFIVLMENFLK